MTPILSGAKKLPGSKEQKVWSGKVAHEEVQGLPAPLAEGIQGAGDTYLWEQKEGENEDMRMIWAATGRSGGGMTTAGDPCTTTGCAHRLATDLRLWIGGQTTQITYAVSPTSHPPRTTATPTTT